MGMAVIQWGMQLTFPNTVSELPQEALSVVQQ